MNYWEGNDGNFTDDELTPYNTPFGTPAKDNATKTIAREKISPYKKNLSFQDDTS